MKRKNVDGAVYSESVRVKTNEDTIRSYVPKKGIDISFTPVYEDEGNKRGNKEFFATLVGSDIVPETSITQRDLMNEVSKWKNIVSDRVRTQNKEPIKHKIVTNVDRELLSGSDILKVRLDNLDEKDINTDPKTGKRSAIVCDEEAKEV